MPLTEKQTKNPPQSQTEKREEKHGRNYFVRLFGAFSLKNEEQFLAFGKWGVFFALLIAELLMMLQMRSEFKEENGWIKFIVLLALCTILTTSEGVQLFAVRGKAKFVFYGIDALTACGFLSYAYGTYPLVFYMLALTQFYIGSETFKGSTVVFAISMPVYTLIYGLQGDFTKFGTTSFWDIIVHGFGALSAMTAHFITVQIALAFYRQYLRLNKAVSDLNESQKKLQKAYEAVAEVSALEERQRIAKEIHDTAGHSITTVIMQTESAKRMIESNPEEAKAKIAAANLQAKHALEELRDSVHLLSGRTDKQTLKDALQNILNESSDGTGIIIRSSIASVHVSDSKYRFLCNSLKEGIANGLRHGSATAFYFELSVDEQIEFLLSDNGKGMDESKLKTGFGLSTMQERARALGGSVEFKTESDEGFEIRIVLPLDKEGN